MTRAAGLAAALVLLAGCATVPPGSPVGDAAETPPLRHLRILHLNDTADLGALARAASVVREARGSLPRVLVTGGGDLLAPSPEALVLDAAPTADAWRRLGLAAATPGDRDLGLGTAVLAARARDSGARWVSANLRTGAGVCCGAAVRQLVDVGGIRVGLTGVTGEDPARASGAAVEAGNPVAAAREAVAALRADGAEVVILLAHAEAPLLELLALTARPDLVLGGHEGTPVVARAGGVPVVRGARGARDVVQVDMWLGADGGVAASDVRFLPATGAAADAEVAGVADRAARALAEAPPRGETRIPLDARPEAFAAGESPLGNLLADLARRATGADVALVDAGSVTPRVLPEGPVPATWPLDLLPGLGPLVVVELTGADLARVLEHAVARLPAPDSRFLHLSGAAIRVDPEALPGKRLVSAAVGAHPLDPARRYRVVATARVAAGGDGYGWLRAAPRLQDVDLAPRLAALLVDRLETGEPLAPSIEGRIVVDGDVAEGDVVEGG